MRIIRILVMLPLLWATIVPEKAWAAEVASSNETKINFNIKSDITLTNGVAVSRYELTVNAPYNFQGYVPVKNIEEEKREKVLARFKSQREKAVFPKEKFVINASAYTAADDECGKSDGITASGVKVKENRTLACPPTFPFGTKIDIEGHGTYVCEDRGGAIKGNHFDIYMQTKKQAFAFGRKNLLAEVIN
ncbi:MAG TPA: 3D domain-containing protein [Patescibacteria group bacterium]